jgi:histidyl-tRNA synthetase
MNKPLQPVRGTHDLIGEAMRMHRHVVETARKVAALYGHEEVAPPIFEFTEVFHRTLGDTSDVVTKETYTFDDRGGESITLRPELTASVVRAFLTAGLTQSLPFKAFYAGPAFRYERPQKGRLRQFHQIGMEVLGADSPWHDVEVLAGAVQVLDALGLKDHVTLEINSLGDVASRTAYREQLLAYLRDHEAELSQESRVRMEKNPLRVLDSKQEEDRKVVANAPALVDAFTAEAQDWFAQVQEGLNAAGIAYVVSPRLVRGLDYYTHTVFECTCGALGAQNTVLAGGRYDGLVAQMGGPQIAGIGWAAGVERLALVLETLGMAAGAPAARPVVVLPMDDEDIAKAFEVASSLRKHGVAVELLVKGNVGKRLKKADKMQASHVVMLGADERAAGVVTCKDMQAGGQTSLTLEALVRSLSAPRS